jgi:hypothetical protein
VGTPLAVCRVMEPQSEARPLQVRSQLTPRFAGSLLTAAANCVEEFAATDDGGAICPDAKAMVVGELLVVPHPINSVVESPHRTNKNSPSLDLVRGHKTDSRFISIFSTDDVTLDLCLVG